MICAVCKRMLVSIGSHANPPSELRCLGHALPLPGNHSKAVLRHEAVNRVVRERALARKIVQKGMSVRAAERAARWAGAKTKQRRQQAKLDPALVARAKTAADRITGFSSRIISNRLEITFADETELEELVEALERAAP